MSSAWKGAVLVPTEAIRIVSSRANKLCGCPSTAIQLMEDLRTKTHFCGKSWLCGFPTGVSLCPPRPHPVRWRRDRTCCERDFMTSNPTRNKFHHVYHHLAFLLSCKIVDLPSEHKYLILC